MFKNVVLGISGGVDSAVACIFLKNKGFNVTACFMRNWDIIDETGYCTLEQDYEDAKWICNKLKVPLVEVNFVKEYWNEVFTYTIEGYTNRETPNPDIQCNRNIKFDKFYKFARKELKADAIATGHYTSTSFGPFLENFKENENVKLLQAKNPGKDQTFFLSQVRQESLRRCMFPLGPHFKAYVKRIAVDNGLQRIAEKKESMGICFIGRRNFKDFIAEYIENKPGKFIDFDTGKTVGDHQGQHMWTIGQSIKSNPVGYYICYKDWKSNDIFVVSHGYHPTLYCDLLITAKPHWICEEPEQLQKNCFYVCYFRFQHLKECIPCRIYKISSDKLIVSLRKPLRAITAGQYAVFYLENQCLGSARITTPGPSVFNVTPLSKRRSIIEKLHEEGKVLDNEESKHENESIKESEQVENEFDDQETKHENESIKESEQENEFDDQETKHENESIQKSEQKEKEFDNQETKQEDEIKIESAV